MHIAVLGAGWAGLAAGLLAARQGHRVTLFEAARSLGGRARALAANLPDGRAVTLDNGQHLLIGAYTQTLALMRSLSIDPHSVLLRTPLTLRFPDGRGLRFPDWPAPWDAVGAIAGARGWTLADKYTLLRTAVLWRRRGFECPASASVDDICSRLTTRVRQELIDPLCVSALNTPPGQASAQVFLRVLRDAMFGVSGASRLLLPRVDLSALVPQAAATAIVRAGGQVLLGRRVERLVPNGV